MTSNAAKSADRSSIEIKDLLRRLHPDNSNHKDRIRRLNKFRNYVLPDAVCPSILCLILLYCSVDFVLVLYC